MEARVKCCGTGKCSLNACGCGAEHKVGKPLVDSPGFICETCGRVASDKEDLCKPMVLK